MTRRRTTARVIPVNRHGEVLLLLVRDPAAPERRYWFTIGGGVDAEETLVPEALPSDQLSYPDLPALARRALVEATRVAG